MKNVNALVVKGPKPENYQIPQTVTSPVERREIRNFIAMRAGQIKSRMDRIYRYNKDRFVETEYSKKVETLTKRQKIVEMLKEYNKDNGKIGGLLKNKEDIMKQLKRLCSKKQVVAEQLEDYTSKIDGLRYNKSGCGDSVDRHGKNVIESEDVIDESTLMNEIKEEFDAKNTKKMEERNRQLKYLNEKIEERLLFGKRDEIQNLFCELENMNAVIEKELVGLGMK